MTIFHKGIITCMMMAGLFACEKNSVYKGEKPDDLDLKDLVVPSGFDWKTSDDVKCVLTTTAPARVGIYTDAACTAASEIADLYIEPGTEPINLVIARGVKEVYMRYMDQNKTFRVQPVTVSKGEVNFTLPGGSQNFSAITVKSESKDDDYSKLNTGGTVLFEDSYPQKGDYDFNDYVMTYEFEAEFDKNRKLKKLEVEIEFVAKGGILPYEPYLCLRGLKTQMIKEIVPDDDTDQGLGVISLRHEGNDNDVILKFTGVAEAMQRMKKQGSHYINTTKGYTTDDFVKLEFDIYFAGNEVNKYEGGDIYDFFLGGEIGGKFTEIHTKEFSSTRLVTEGKVEAGAYCTEDNFVWVMKIAGDLYDNSKKVGDYEVFPYLNEKDNFLKGYPDFKGYVEASGKGVYDWCGKSNRVDNYLIFFED